MIIAETGKLIKQYFENKTDQLIAVSKQAVCEHNGLKGSHREDLIKIYLNEIIPKRYEIGQGMVYGEFTRSNEADIVLWDSFNFPNLKMNGHSMYFAESVNAVIEVKTNYNSNTELDVVKKSKVIKSILRHPRETLDNRLFHVEANIESILEGREYQGFIGSQELIKTCVVFFNGGETLESDIFEKYEDLYVEWPDIALFLEAGKLIVQGYDYSNNKNFIRIYKSGRDSLLLFTRYLLEILSEQVVLVEGSLYFEEYIQKELCGIEYSDYDYFPCRPISGTRFPISRR